MKKQHTTWCNEGGYWSNLRLTQPPLLRSALILTNIFLNPFFFARECLAARSVKGQSASCLASLQPRVLIAEEVKVSPIWLLSNANVNLATLLFMSETDRFLLQDSRHIVRKKKKELLCRWNDETSKY